MATFENEAMKIGALVDSKNKAYGDSFAKCGEFLRLLYPNGISLEQYTDAMCLIRIFDKLMRIATDKSAYGESPYQDIVGYALLGFMKDGTPGSLQGKEGKESPQCFGWKDAFCEKVCCDTCSVAADCNFICAECSFYDLCVEQIKKNVEDKDEE